MSFLSGLLGSGLGEKVTDLISKRVPDVNLAANIASEARKLVEDHEHERVIKAMDLEAQIAKDQSAINQTEAQSESLFKSGWRPMVGWACVAGVIYAILLRPFLVWGSLIAGWPVPPDVSFVELMGLLFPLLGLGAYRTYEKTR